jgi:Holliday junction resolvase
MTHATDLAGKQAEYMARVCLESQGYHVVKSAGAHSPVDLVAWKHTGHPLLIQVRRSRRRLDLHTQVSWMFRDDIMALQAVCRPYFASSQLWLWTDRQGWRVFEVLPGGIEEVGALD